MTIKKCKICNKEFDAKGNTKCCSPECSKINKQNANDRYEQSDEGKEIRKKYRESDEGKEIRKKYRESDKGKKANKKYEQSDKGKKTRKEYYENNKDEIIKQVMLRNQKIISELAEQYNGDLEKILENIPSRWQLREAQMQVYFNESYYDGIIAKIESTPCCEVTGEKNNLVVHHLWSFNLRPALGNDVSNMVRITEDVHKVFHGEYGYGDNTPEQWERFVSNYSN